MCADTGDKKRLILRAMLAAAIIIGIVYVPAIFFQFVNWDDDVHLVANYFLQTPQQDFLKAVFSTTVNGIYIPLTTLSFAVEKLIWGMDPRIYHLNNILLHIAVSVLLIPFGCALGMSVAAAWLAALIFGLHPMHVESVAWVTERKDVLFALFYLVGLILYLKYISFESVDAASRHRKMYFQKWGMFLLAVICAVLSTLAKPMAMSFPLIAGLMDIYLRRRITLGVIAEKIIIGLPLVPIGLFTYQNYAQHDPVPLMTSVLLWIWSFMFYLYKFVAMDYYVLIYQSPLPVNLANPLHALSVMGFVGLVVAIYLFRRCRMFVWALAFYLCSIFLVLRWDMAKDINIVADRFMYLPSIGLCFLFGVMVHQGLLRFKNRKVVRNVLLAICVSVFFLLIIKIRQQIFVWRDSVSLWQHQLTYQPNAAPALAYNKLASAYSDQIQLLDKLSHQGVAELTNDEKETFTEILNMYQRSLTIKPDYADSYYRLGKIAQMMKDVSRSEDYFLRALRYDPGHFEASLELGEIYLQQNDTQRAQFYFENAIKITPDNQNVRKRVRDLTLQK